VVFLPTTTLRSYTSVCGCNLVSTHAAHPRQPPGTYHHETSSEPLFELCPVDSPTVIIFEPISFEAPPTPPSQSFIYPTRRCILSRVYQAEGVQYSVPQIGIWHNMLRVGTACCGLEVGTACYELEVGTSCFRLEFGTACYRLAQRATNWKLAQRASDWKLAQCATDCKLAQRATDWNLA
jgi:hypothetical protein